MPPGLPQAAEKWLAGVACAVKRTAADLDDSPRFVTSASITRFWPQVAERGDGRWLNLLLAGSWRSLCCSRALTLPTPNHFLLCAGH